MAVSQHTSRELKMAIVIVGAGHAAGQAAASLRQGGYQEEIIIIGDETREILSGQKHHDEREYPCYRH
jgi:NADH dehydrogenase FAD-containing subunit